MIQRIRQLFINSEEQIVEPIERDEQPIFENKDLNVKMAYQYPKGKFRFPLIPDDDDIEVKKETPKIERLQTKHASIEKKADFVKKEKSPNITIRKVRVQSKSFQPTEVPSPVFGYKKTEMPNPSEPVVFELESFLKEEKESEKTVHEADNVFELNENEKEESFQDIQSEENEVKTIPEVEIEEKIIDDIDDVDNLDIQKMDLTFQEDGAVTSGESSEKSLMELQQKSDGGYEKIQIPSCQENNEGVIQNHKEQDQKDVIFKSHILNTNEGETEKTNDCHITPKETGGISEIMERKEEISDTLDYVFPSIDLLKPPVRGEISGEWIDRQKQRLNDTLTNFHVGATVENVTQGPSVTRFEVQPEPGVKVNKITNLTDDIKLSLAAKDIRIEAPIPGKHTVGIEVPNLTRRPVFISEIIASKEFSLHPSPLSVVLGLDISGNPIVTDIKKMPHGLIAGATGSGKSVCINSIIVSILYKSNPKDVKLLLIDPKMVELAPYNEIPHLVSPVITDVKAATASLKWAVEEMERRYELFAHTGVRDITRFNELAEKHRQEKLPFIVIIIDELADLMMMSPQDVEEAICRIAQKARACGIHLIIATQRPSVDVITGLIKANIPTRIAFSVSSQVDSRTIIDMSGAERLLGQGDMLFLGNGMQKPIRLQGTYVSDEEIDRVVSHVKNEQQPTYLFEQDDLIKKAQVNQEDEIFYEACEFVVEKGVASTSSLQRHFSIGYNRAARLIEMMEDIGLISESKGSKPRDVLMDKSDLELLKEYF